MIGFGGSNGGGKSDCALGMAANLHKRSVIFRREFPQLRSLIERSKEILTAPGMSYNESFHLWRLGTGRGLEFSAIQYDKDKRDQQGRDRDLIVFDQAEEFTEAIVRYVMIWNRTTSLKYKAQTLLTFNPPTNVEGQWIIRFFAPWIGDKPTAKPGELLWFTSDINGKEYQVESGEPFMRGDEKIIPRSRTFFPARVTDNPYWEGTGYVGTLQSLPEPLRSQALYGDMKAGAKDDAWQVIPAKWLRAAMDRWEPRDHPGQLTCVGVDVARGGDDATVLAPRYGDWWAPLLSVPGVRTATGGDVLRLMTPYLLGGGYANVDVIGVGAAVIDLMKERGMNGKPINFASASTARDRSKNFGFMNLRAECYWRMRELLDPDRVLDEGESLPQIPDDDELFTDLVSPRYEPTPRGIKIEPKDDIKDRIGRSPDRGDALVLTLAGAGRFDLIKYAERLAETSHDDQS